VAFWPSAIPLHGDACTTSELLSCSEVDVLASDEKEISSETAAIMNFPDMLIPLQVSLFKMGCRLALKEINECN
jgi:hypothetical protein